MARAYRECDCSYSPFFRVPDEIVVRIRKYKFDDGYEGSRVDMRSRGHLADDHGTNLKRVRTARSPADDGGLLHW